MPQAATKSGVASVAAATDKARRYGGKAICAASETLGYKGNGTSVILDYLQQHAGRQVSRGRRKLWELRLGIALARCLAMAIP